MGGNIPWHGKPRWEQGQIGIQWCGSHWIRVGCMSDMVTCCLDEWLPTTEPGLQADSFYSEIFIHEYFLLRQIKQSLICGWAFHGPELASSYSSEVVDGPEQWLRFTDVKPSMVRDSDSEPFCLESSMVGFLLKRQTRYFECLICGRALHGPEQWLRFTIVKPTIAWKAVSIYCFEAHGKEVGFEIQ